MGVADVTDVKEMEDVKEVEGVKRDRGTERPPRTRRWAVFWIPRAVVEGVLIGGRVYPWSFS